MKHKESLHRLVMIMILFTILIGCSLEKTHQVLASEGTSKTAQKEIEDVWLQTWRRTGLAITNIAPLLLEQDQDYAFLSYYEYKRENTNQLGEKVQRIDFKIPQFNDSSPAAIRLNRLINQMVSSDLTSEEKFYQDAYFSEKGSLEQIALKSSFVRGYDVTYSDYQLTNIVYNGYIYKGGAHGMPIWNSHVFDRKNGVELRLSDLFGDEVDTVITSCYQAFDQLIEEDQTRFFPDAKEWVRRETKESQNFYLTPEGITFFHYPYALGPYSSGIIEVTVPYEQLPTLQY
ncbi:DUF3298 and DUF4163 domain-containing protein [Isobaculum melis]|uniref:DUF3298 domain-containing protein n=1 Tax=Isobaculum melis TaxID=142588 RepID=A0A1H9QDM9_9LACT|nr:DUF3298 and DUF4163 domain-containing protein [Isobaculum melis]SER58646.1 protein of unknown function [Isobaculum melis]